jgi:hypothetical protein
MEDCELGGRGTGGGPMKDFSSFIQNRNDLSGLHDDAVVMRLGDFINALDEQHPDKDRLLEIREDVPEPGTYAVRLLSKGG